MATDNVFGRALTAGATRMERAIEALKERNADGKRDAALRHVRQKKFRGDLRVCTLGIFYNATGETLVFTGENSSYGKIKDTYPRIVQNGQWGTFFHGKTPFSLYGSVGFVVYNVKTLTGNQSCDQLIAWSTPFDDVVRFKNQTYCDIFDAGKVDDPGEVYMKMDKHDSGQKVTTWKGMMVSTTTEMGTNTPVFEAEFTLRNAATSLSIGASSTVDQQDDVEE